MTTLGFEKKHHKTLLWFIYNYTEEGKIPALSFLTGCILQEGVGKKPASLLVLYSTIVYIAP